MKNSFLTDKILTYIGNKRKLLPFIRDSMEFIISQDEFLSEKSNNEITFFDIFSGSGIVSRWGKQEGYRVYSNDLEVYSRVISDAFIGTNDDELGSIFSKLCLDWLNEEISEDNSYDFVISKLNQIALYYVQYLKIPTDFNIEKSTHDSFYLKNDIEYFSKHYAPKDINNLDIDFQNERLFYTQRNARFIDAVIFVLNSEQAFQLNQKAKQIILAELLYYMSVHNNTSGVMKGFHNGWGGKSEAALDRIMKPFILEGIHLIHGVQGVSFTCKAEEVFEKEDFFKENVDMVDIIYADPPYNQHQYSANYHLLTSAVKNDRIDPGPVIQGARAGIRKDHNRSSFSASNKRDPDTNEQLLIDGNIVRAVEYSFWKFIKSLEGKARYLIVSYNNEGLLTHDELMTILNNNEKNTVTFRTKTHDKFKGGKNTNVSNKVSEFIFIVTLGKRQSALKLQKEIEELHKVTFIDLIDDSTFSLDDLRRIHGFSCFERSGFYHFVDKEGYLFSLDRSLRIQSFNRDAFTIEKIQLIQECKIEKENLIEYYLSDIDTYRYNKESIKDILKSFKIKKYADYLPQLNEKIFSYERLLNCNDN